jgi:hypothetical protein
MTHRTITAEEARALREAATPGPWRSAWDDPEPAPVVDWRGGAVIYREGTSPDDDKACHVVSHEWYDGPLTFCLQGDAALIAAAPDLAATVEALHDEVERLRSVVSRVAEVCQFAADITTREDLDFDDQVVNKLVWALESFSHGGWKAKAEALRALTKHGSKE